ncbi:MAG: ATP-binding protein [Planctomycetota bacterium]
MVMCFETGDPVRLEQIRTFFCDPSLSKEYSDHSIYIYDPWNGLGLLDKRSNRINPSVIEQESGVGRKFQEETGNRIQDLARCLNVIDDKLRNTKTIFILHGLSQDQEGKPRFLSALKAWAISGELIQYHSIVILFGSGLSGLLDSETKDLIATVEVKLGSDSEYERLIAYLANIFSISLANEEMGILKGAVRGLNLHQAEAILRESYALKARFDLEQIKVSKGDLVKRTGVLEIEEPKGGFESIGGYRAVKEFIQRKIIDVIHAPERAKQFAVPLPRGILLFGPPGTGKTLFAKALTKAIQIPFIRLKTEDIYQKYLGESGQQMRSAIRTAEQMSPAIVFIDEIDRFGRRAATSDSAGEETRRVFSQLLEWLGDDSRKAIIVGTTNRPQDLDEAFIRTGRFDYKIPILYPDAEARLEILRIHLGLPDLKGNPSPKSKPPLALSDREFLSFLQKEIVPRTSNYTGAELEELVTRAKRTAFERNAIAVEGEDFLKGLSSFRLDPLSRSEQQKQFEELTMKFTDDETFLKGLIGEMKDV